MEITIGPRRYVDGFANINCTENDVLRSYDSAIHFQHKKRLQLSEIKWKMLTINSKKPNITTVSINDNLMYIPEFKYLGNIINSNSNNKSLILQRRKNVFLVKIARVSAINFITSKKQHL